MSEIDFVCPTCAAKPGEKCETLTGMALPGSHPQRPSSCAACDAERAKTYGYRACQDCEDGTGHQGALEGDEA